MKLVLAAVCALVAMSATPGDTAAQGRDRSVDNLRVALHRPPGVDVGRHTWADPPPRKLGVFTLEQPVAPGEIARLRLPVGELVSNAARTIRAAHQRRREATARREVQQALSDLIAASPRPQH